jgi:hypothetical protein
VVLYGKHGRRKVKEAWKRNKTMRSRRGMTHILRLPPGSVVTFTKLQKSMSPCDKICEQTCHSPTIVEYALLCTTFGGFLLLLGLYLRCLRFDFACTSERAVNYICCINVIR